MKKYELLFLLLLAFSANLVAAPTIRTVGTGGDYSTLSEALTAINEGDLKGMVILQIISDITEGGTCVLYETGHNGTSDYISVTIYPTDSGYTIDGDIDGPLIDLNGAGNVTIDGRVGGTTPNTKDLTITNISTGSSASTIQFSESATTNTVKYCIIKGAETSASSGIIFFTTASTGSGNDGNTIDNNDITGDAAGRPVNAIYSEGSASYDNSGNTISSNNIFDFIRTGTASNGIFLYSNTTAWTITGNSFYETTSFNPTANVTYYVIQITSGNGYTITDNYIGGSSASCSGTWTKNANARNNIFYSIYLSLASGTATSVQNNTIKNFNWSNSGNVAWTGIHIANGDVNIGTITGNTIGATTGTGSVTVTGGVSGNIVYGINIASGGTVDCQNNNIGSITVANTANAGNFYGINKSSTAGTTTISNNIIGSTTSAYSINASSASATAGQSVYGINNSGTGTITISTNTIAKMINGTTNINPSTTGRINGISSTAGTTTVSNNTIYDLTIANADTASSQTASICGMALIGNTAPKTISGNTIYNLSNAYSSFAGKVIGLFYIGSTGTNVVKENFIHSLSVTGVSSTTASIYGIKISSGATTYSNNIICLGGATKTTIYGIYETGIAGNNNSLYFNTVYIGGDGNGGTNKSYALYSAVNTNTRNFRNNIFVNARSTTSGSDLHYAIYIVSTGGSLTCDYNDYLASGALGATLGYYGADKTVLPIVPGQDISSFAIAPGFSSPGGTTAADYLPSATSLVSVTGTGITTDYDGGPARSTTFPSMGAFEYSVAPTAFTWTGSSTTNWSTTANWNYNIVPSSSTNAIIINVTNEPVVNEAPATPAECLDLTISSGAVLTIAAGKALKVDGTLTNNAGNSGLVIKSDANGNDGKLLNNTASVPATVELYLSGGAGGFGPIFHYIVPPVTTMTIGTTPTIAETKTALGLTNFVGDLMSYSESAAGSSRDLGWQYFDGYTGGGVYSSSPFTSIVSSKGYNFRFTAADKITFTGTLNDSPSDYSFNLNFSNLGWNLVGNPYPCNYDLNGVTELNNSDNVDNTIYFNYDGGYGEYNVLTNTSIPNGLYSDIIAPMQGFFVHVTAAATLDLPIIGYKTLNTAAPLRSKGADIIKKIRLKLNNGTVPDETVVCLIDKATSGFDGDYDAYKLSGGSSTTPFIYTELNSVKYAINSIKDPGSSSAIIPVTVVLKTDGTYKIDITEFENLDGIDVALKHGSDVTVLSKGSSYTFTSVAGTFTNFQIVIGNIATGVENLTKENLKTWYSNNYLYISCPDVMSSDKGKIVIYDIQGKIVYTNNLIYLAPGQMIQLALNLPKGVYITHVTANNQPYISKIVVF